MASILLAVLLLGIAPMSSAEISGESAAEGGGSDDWKFDLALYGWLTDMKGDATVGDVRVEVDPQLWNDILSNLDGALFGAFEARYRERWIFQLDLFGAQISAESESGPFQIGFGPRSLESGGLQLDIPRVETTVGPIEVETTTLLAQSRLMLGYRLFDRNLLHVLGREPGDDPRRLVFDAFVGIRAWYLKAEVDVESPPVEVPGFTIEPSLVAFPRLKLPDVELGGFTFGGRDLDVSKSNWWIDPIVGFRAMVDPCEGFRFALAGNVGGFGIGSASKFAWEASAIGFFHLGESWSLGLGYRAQGLERERNGLETDLIIHGPVVGVVIHF